MAIPMGLGLIFGALRSDFLGVARIFDHLYLVLRGFGWLWAGFAGY
jgi:hypothetical protein